MAHNRRPLAQSKYFYSRTWDKKQDNNFISMLAWQGNFSNKQTNPDDPNWEALEFAKGVVDLFSRKDIPMATYVKRLEILRKHYETFKCIL
ncbi:UNVERIFIED_CONTAM: hypothetical protein Slati_4188400 [Sesamum latifolium]|uniref:Myb/SANT-like domain-containing protein n=1 Tax=Sesamum latifolium TaxID=2727402 RepID=A0AAW2TA26_9LAMI